jgi:hypothetical protein
MVHAAKALDDLEVPPNNKLEKLPKNRVGQHSIRINACGGLSPPRECALPGAPKESPARGGAFGSSL